MIRAFLDTNVLIDWILEKDRPNRTASLQIAQAILDRKIEGFVSTQSLIDTAYVAGRSGRSFAGFELLFRKMLRYLNLGGISSFEILHALDHHSGDFEDDAQIAYADNLFCGFFVSGDLELKHHAPVPDMEILTPTEFIERLQQ